MQWRREHRERKGRHSIDSPSEMAERDATKRTPKGDVKGTPLPNKEGETKVGKMADTKRTALVSVTAKSYQRYRY